MKISYGLMVFLAFLIHSSLTRVTEKLFFEMPFLELLTNALMAGLIMSIVYLLFKKIKFIG